MADFSIKQKVDCLKKYFGAGTLTSNSKNYDVWCPYCNDRRKEKRKLSIKLEGALWHCWVCGTSGRHVAFVVRKFRLGDLTELLKIWPSNYQVKNEDGSEVQKPRLMSDFSLLVTSTAKNPDVLALRRYCRDRGLTDDDLWYYKIGMSNDFMWKRRVIVPSFDARGELNYFTGRTVDADGYPKYNVAEVNRLEVVFNELYIDWSKRLVLCEGPFDVMKCGTNAVPLLGNTLNENSRLFCNIVAYRTPIALALDADMRERTLQMSKKFASYDVPCVVVDLGKHKDPGEMTKHEFDHALSHAKELDWTGRFMEKLQKARNVSTKI